MKVSPNLINDQVLHLVQNIVRFGVWHFDLTTNKLDWDNGMFDIYEVDPTSFKGNIEDFRSRLHEEDVDYVETLMKYAAAQTNVLQASFRIITDSGKTKYIDGNLRPITDLDGKVIGFIGVNKDVTEKKLNEAAKRTSEENYKRLLKEFSKLSVVAQRSLNAVVITDPEGRIEWVNDAFTKMTGYQLREVKNAKPGDLLQGDGTDRLSVQLMSNAIRQKKSFEIDVVNYRKNGEKYWVQIYANPFFNEAGEVEGFVSVQTETTERKLMEERIRTERDRAKTYLDVVPSVVVILNPYGTILLANKAAMHLLGEDPAGSIIGKNWFDSYVPEELRDELKQIFTDAVEGRTEMPEFYENEILDVQGDKKLVEWHNVFMKDEQGYITSCIAAGKDITEQRRIEMELKESKDLYSSVFNGSMNAVLLADDNNHYLDANPAAEKLLGYSREELQTMSITDLATDRKLELLQDLWSDFMDTQHQTGLIELRRKDNRKVIAEYRATANIKPGVHLSVLTDVTDKIRYENAIALQNKALKEIAWIQSHEIRRPVSNILGLFEILKLSPGALDHDLFRSMEQSVKELDGLIKAMVIKSRSIEEMPYSQQKKQEH